MATASNLVLQNLKISPIRLESLPQEKCTALFCTLTPWCYILESFPNLGSNRYTTTKSNNHPNSTNHEPYTFGATFFRITSSRLSKLSKSWSYISSKLPNFQLQRALKKLKTFFKTELTDSILYQARLLPSVQQSPRRALRSSPFFGLTFLKNSRIRLNLLLSNCERDPGLFYRLLFNSPVQEPNHVQIIPSSLAARSSQLEARFLSTEQFETANV